MMTSSVIQYNTFVPSQPIKQNPIFLWATPRSVSTAFERVMKNSNELIVCHEPYTEAYYFGPDRISERYGDLLIDKNRAQINPNEINRKIFSDVFLHKVFMKELAFQAEPYIEDNILSLATNIFITRHPHKVYASLLKVKPDFTEDEFGFLAMKRIYDRVMKIQKNTIVVDGDEFRNSPQKVIRKVCDFIGVSYTAELLHWDDGKIRDWKAEEVESQLKYHSTLENSRTIIPALEQKPPCIKPEHREIIAQAEIIYDELGALTIEVI